MGTKAQELVGTDVKKIVVLLNKAFADEWLAYYQYWIGAKVARGQMRGAVVGELEQHAAEELKHAVMLTERIIQLGGTPILTPEGWYKQTNCGYDAPEDPSVKALLKQNIKGEQCAIEVYQKLSGATKDKDVVTYQLALEIMADEIEHEEDLESLLEDMSQK
ncbi:MAG: ferritin-like domain-containing protein [Candidatus Omnitrophica bacterium]|nr:ferritin-like domain-containing protein [Candidatus Omnitrophota bacterium]